MVTRAGRFLRSFKKKKKPISSPIKASKPSSNKFSVPASTSKRSFPIPKTSTSPSGRVVITSPTKSPPIRRGGGSSRVFIPTAPVKRSDVKTELRRIDQTTKIKATPTRRGGVTIGSPLTLSQKSELRKTTDLSEIELSRSVAITRNGKLFVETPGVSKRLPVPDIPRGERVTGGKSQIRKLEEGFEKLAGKGKGKLTKFQEQAASKKGKLDGGIIGKRIAKNAVPVGKITSKFIKTNPKVINQLIGKIELSDSSIKELRIAGLQITKTLIDGVVFGKDAVKFLTVNNPAWNKPNRDMISKGIVKYSPKVWNWGKEVVTDRDKRKLAGLAIGSFALNAMSSVKLSPGKALGNVGGEFILFFAGSGGWRAVKAIDKKATKGFVKVGSRWIKQSDLLNEIIKKGGKRITRLKIVGKDLIMDTGKIKEIIDKKSIKRRSKKAIGKIEKTLGEKLTRPEKDAITKNIIDSTFKKGQRARTKKDIERILKSELSEPSLLNKFKQNPKLKRIEKLFSKKKKIKKVDAKEIARLTKKRKDLELKVKIKKIKSRKLKDPEKAAREKAKKERLKIRGRTKKQKEQSKIDKIVNILFKEGEKGKINSKTIKKRVSKILNKKVSNREMQMATKKLKAKLRAEFTKTLGFKVQKLTKKRKILKGKARVVTKKTPRLRDPDVEMKKLIERMKKLSKKRTRIKFEIMKGRKLKDPDIEIKKLIERMKKLSKKRKLPKLKVKVKPTRQLTPAQARREIEIAIKFIQKKKEIQKILKKAIGKGKTKFRTKKQKELQLKKLRQDLVKLRKRTNDFVVKKIPKEITPSKIKKVTQSISKSGQILEQRPVIKRRSVQKFKQKAKVKQKIEIKLKTKPKIKRVSTISRIQPKTSGIRSANALRILSNQVIKPSEKSALRDLSGQTTKFTTSLDEKIKSAEKIKEKVIERTKQRFNLNFKEISILEKIIKVPKIIEKGKKRKKPKRFKFKPKKRPTKKKAKPTIGYNSFAKVRGKKIKLNKKPLSKAGAKNRTAYILDNSTAVTGSVKKIGKVKKVAKVKSKEIGAFSRAKTRKFRIVNGKRVPLKNTVIERRGKPRINTRGEKKGLSAARVLKDLRRGKNGRKKKKKRR